MCLLFVWFYCLEPKTTKKFYFILRTRFFGCSLLTLSLIADNEPYIYVYHVRYICTRNHTVDPFIFTTQLLTNLSSSSSSREHRHYHHTVKMHFTFVPYSFSSISRNLCTVLVRLTVRRTTAMGQRQSRRGILKRKLAHLSNLHVIFFLFLLRSAPFQFIGG